MQNVGARGKFSFQLGIVVLFYYELFISIARMRASWFPLCWLVALLYTIIVICCPCVNGNSAWYDCPHDLVQKYPFKYRLQCLNLSVPLDYSNPKLGNITAFATKLCASSTPAKAQLWMMQGGPGGSGESEWPFVFQDQLMDLLDGKFDIFFPDHRGVGYQLS